MSSAEVSSAEAPARPGLSLRLVHDVAGCQQVADLLSRIWSIKGGSILDMHVLIALAHSDSYVLLAHLEDEPVGAAVGFFGAPGHAFHSHIVGVLPNAAGKGVGRAIKAHQRQWCLDRGIQTMTWTYDPLVARNAHFNIRVLGALPREYHADFYGPMRDTVNAGQETDRVLVRWNLSGGPPAERQVDRSATHVALAGHGDVPGEPSLTVPAGTVRVLVAVPGDVETIRVTDPPLAQRWRQLTRLALQSLMADDWQVTDFLDHHYVLRRLP